MLQLAAQTPNYRAQKLIIASAGGAPLPSYRNRRSTPGIERIYEKLKVFELIWQRS